MSSSRAISPNDPDIMPDYVDGKTGTAAPAQSPASPRRMPAESPLPEAAAAPPAASAHREGECVPNVPDIEPAFISESEAKALARGAAPRIDSESDPALSDASAAAASGGPLWKWQATATVFLTGIFGVLVFSQAISAAAVAATLPVWAQYLLLIPFGICCLAVLWVCCSLFRSWYRLRAVRQVDLAALEQLRLRAQTRQETVEQYREARAWIEDYVKAYPLSDAAQPRLRAAGLSAEQIGALAAGRDFLVGRAQDSRSWLEEFREQFQSVLDETAGVRVTDWSLKAAVCAVASPLPLLDSVLVLGISLKLIKDLSVIYNVRTSRTGSLLILRQAVIAAFIAGVAEDATEAAGGLAADQLAELVGGGLGARIAGAAIPKLGEGAVNALFIRRIGKAAVRLLQPAKPSHRGK